jgi:hypothetical protein
MRNRSSVLAACSTVLKSTALARAEHSTVNKLKTIQEVNLQGSDDGV